MAKNVRKYRNPGPELRATITIVEARRPRVFVELGPDIVVGRDEVETKVFLAICEPTWPSGAGGFEDQARQQLGETLRAWLEAVPFGTAVAELERRGYQQVAQTA